MRNTYDSIKITQSREKNLISGKEEGRGWRMKGSC